MTARDERLEAAVKALREQGYDGPTAYRNAAAGIIVYDAVRAVEEQRTVRQMADRQRQSNAVQETQTPAASPVGADPIRPVTINEHGTYEMRNGRWVRTGEGAAQPPSEAEIEQVMLFGPTRESARAMLLAAARVRAGG